MCFCLFWVATAVLDIQRQLLKRRVSLSFFVQSFSLWGESCHFEWNHLGFLSVWVGVVLQVSLLNNVAGTCLVILKMFWLHACAMTRSLSSLLSVNSEYRNQQHIHFSMQTIYRCENIQPRWQIFWSLLRKIYLLPPQIHALKCLFRCMSFPFYPHSVICCPPIWLRLSICFELQLQQGWWAMWEGEMDWGWSWAYGEFAGCFLEVCFQFEPCSVMQRKASEQFAPVTYLLSCLPSPVHEATAEVLTGTIHVLKTQAMFEAYKTLMNIWDVVFLNVMHWGKIACTKEVLTV